MGEQEEQNKSQRPDNPIEKLWRKRTQAVNSADENSREERPPRRRKSPPPSRGLYINKQSGTRTPIDPGERNKKSKEK